MEAEKKIDTLKKLGDKILQVLDERDALSKKIFDEGREPTQEEWAEINRLEKRYYNYVEIRQHFYPPKQEEDKYIDKMWDAHFKKVASRIKNASHFQG